MESNAEGVDALEVFLGQVEKVSSELAVLLHQLCSFGAQEQTVSPYGLLVGGEQTVSPYGLLVGGPTCQHLAVLEGQPANISRTWILDL